MKAVSLAVLWWVGGGSARLLCVLLQSWGRVWPLFSECKVIVPGQFVTSLSVVLPLLP